MRKFHRNIAVFQIVVYGCFYYIIAQNARSDNELLFFRIFVAFFFIFSVYMSVINPIINNHYQKKIKKMEIKYTVKIKDSQNPPLFNSELGKGVLETGTINIDENTSRIFLASRLNEVSDTLKNNWIEVVFDGVD